MTKNNNFKTKALASIGTLGYFMSSFPYATEWLAQYIDLTANTLGISTKKLPRFLGHEKISGLPALYYAIGFIIALAAIAGFCYAAFYNLLSCSNNSTKKTDKNLKVQKIINFIVLCGTTLITIIWISGASLTIFLLHVRFTLISKNVITDVLIFLGILACISYVKMYKSTLPSHSGNNQENNRSYSKILDYLSMFIFSVIGFFCNTYFIAYLTQNYIFPHSKHKLLFCDMSLGSFIIGALIGLFFTVSAVYCYSRMYVENESVAHTEHKVSLTKKIFLKSALIGFIGIMILDIFYPISISLTYMAGHQRNSISLIFIYAAAFILSVLCTIGPYQRIKTAVEDYNHTKISFKFSCC